MSTEANDDGSVVFDRDAALEGLGDDLELLSEMAELFLCDVPGLVEQIQAAASGRDGPALQAATHQLKGAASNFHAHATVEAARRLERMGEENELGDVEAAREALLGELDRLRPALEKLGAS